MEIMKRIAAILDKPKVARWVRIGAVVLSLGLVAWATLVLIDVYSHPPHDSADPEHQKSLGMLQLAVIIAGGAGVVFAIILALQAFRGVFVAPTGDQIIGDLVASLWGLPFSVPLVFVALDGAPAVSTWLPAVLLIIAGAVVTSIRPRSVEPTPPGPPSTAPAGSPTPTPTPTTAPD